jgi:hypothetical protein
MFNLGLGLLVGGLLLASVWDMAGLFLSLCGLAVWMSAALRAIWTQMRGGALSPAAQPTRGPEPSAPMLRVEGDRAVALDDPEIPPSIRVMVQADAKPGDTLWRCVRRDGPRWGLLSWLDGRERPLVLEWWLLDADGELIEAYWLE